VFQRNSVQVGYNVQASIDSKNKLLVEYETGDVNDTRALAPMALRTKILLNVESMNVLADKGYHTGEQLQQCHDNSITTFVSPKAPSTKDIGLYPVTSFTYDKEKGEYTCPQGHSMKTNGTWHNHSDERGGGKSAYRFQRYTTPACKTCKARHLCTQSTTNGRYIDRSEYAPVTEANAKRVNESPGYYRQRQQIAEHMFGTLKRQRGFTHTHVRGKEKVLGEVGLMFIGYNLTRCISILGVANLINALKKCCLLVLKHIKRLILSNFDALLFQNEKLIPTR